MFQTSIGQRLYGRAMVIGSIIQGANSARGSVKPAAAESTATDPTVAAIVQGSENFRKSR